MYKDVNEYELLYLYRVDREAASHLIVNQYHRLIWSIVLKFQGAMNQMGISKDDLFQEGMLGLLEALECYREDLKVPFRNFACLCAERQMRSLIRKHSGLNYSIIHNSVSLDQSLVDDDSMLVMDTIADSDCFNDPVWLFYYRYSIDQVKEMMANFSDFEKDVLNYRALGYSYKEIAEATQVSYKRVDNTIQKLKGKLVCLFD